MRKKTEGFTILEELGEANEGEEEKSQEGQLG